MTTLLKLTSLLSLILTGAMFGFFYAWICSTMWGLDQADPRIAIEAMQEMNASVRNAAFAPAFFGTAPMLLVTAIIAFKLKQSPAGFLFLAGSIIYLVGGNILTFSVNVPMNEALALIKVPEDAEQARVIWEEYSPKWQFWNQTRTVFSGISLLLTGLAIMQINWK